MTRWGWWRPERSLCARGIAWTLAVLMGVQTLGCAGSARVIPYATNVSLITPWRYYDLWQALRVGRGLLIGTTDGRTISGKFVSGGAKTVRVHTASGIKDMDIREIRYLINVIDLSLAREGALTGGVIGFGTGLALAYATGGLAPAPSARPARPVNSRVARGSNDGKSSSDPVTGDSRSTNSESSTNTQPSASSTEGGQSSTSNAEAGAAGASSESSGGSSTANSDPTQTGSTTYQEGGQQSSGSSAGGGGTANQNQQPQQSSGNSSVVVNVGAEGGSSNRSSAGNTEQPAGGSSMSPVWRMFFFSVGFAALGGFIGWMVGKTKKKAVPRVDYVLFPANLEGQGTRSPDQYLADQIVLPSGEQPAETLLPGSRFDSPRSAMLFEQFAQTGTVVRLANGIGGVITETDARTFHLFPTVKHFTQAVVVTCGASTERAGVECRYLAIVTSGDRAAPTVSLQRLSPPDVIRLGTLVNLMQTGIVQ